MHGARLPLLRSKRILAHLALCAGALVMLYPLFWLASSSLKPSNQIFTDTGLWVSAPRFQNYVDGWNGAALPFSIFFVNSFTIAALAVVGNVVACSLVAYAFARLQFALANAFRHDARDHHAAAACDADSAVHSVLQSRLGEYHSAARRSEISRG